MEIVKLIGSDVLPDDQKLTLEIARVVRLGYLQQNAFHKDDTCVPIEKQAAQMRVILYLYDRARSLVTMGHPMSVLKQSNIFDRVINIWGADHHGHVKRLQCALDALGLDGTHRLEIVLMQLVRMMQGGEVVRMSKRTGKSLTLTDLLDEIPVDAARFFFNSRAAETQMEFDLDLAVKQDSDNPLYYVQYAHARICSVIKNCTEDGVAMPDTASVDLSVLTGADERQLVKTIAVPGGNCAGGGQPRPVATE